MSYSFSFMTQTDKETQRETNTEVHSPEFKSITKPQGSFLSNEIINESQGDPTPPFPDPDPYKPVFQEIPCACALAHLPPLLEHSASYPCSSIPAESTPFPSPLKSAMLKNESHSFGRSISA
uniref:Uncharacterized protein n=1 Tax=Varanus komodoensis TaxID=61221 RepID=A0A8D2IN34_VARKO